MGMSVTSLVVVTSFLAVVPLAGKKQVNHQRSRRKFKFPLMERPSLI